MTARRFVGLGLLVLVMTGPAPTYGATGFAVGDRFPLDTRKPVTTPGGSVSFAVGNRFTLDTRKGVTAVGEETEPVLPGDYRLYPNSPNPFNATTLIRYAIPRRGRVDLTVYDLLGQRVRTLVIGEVTAGVHTAIWDGRDAKGKPVGSGVYLYLLRAEQFRQVRRMVLLR